MLPNISSSELVFYWGIAKLVRQRVLIPSSVGSSPATPAILLYIILEILYPYQKITTILFKIGFVGVLSYTIVLANSFIILTYLKKSLP